MNMNLIDEAQQEHLDFVAGAASEMQNCFSEARSYASHLAAKESVAINAALEAGRFVAVCASPYFCKSTDAFAGMIPHRIADFGTRGEADACLSAKYESGEFDPDCDYYVLPRLAPTPVVVPVEDDGCPF